MIYRLKRDLPTFKAGDIFERRENGNLYWCAYNQDKKVFYGDDSKHWANEVMAYHNRTLLNFPNILEDWFEKVEEPTHYWCVDYIECGVDKMLIDQRDPEQDMFNKSIGNWFETEDEAWDAVEKLRALKRLQDKGFRFKNWTRNQTGTIDIFCGWDNYPHNKCVKKDLDLLFGGKK